MEYNFYILTNDGIKNATVNTDSDFDCAPFGYVPYRVVSSCTCEPKVIEDFWSCVDMVLEKHGLTSYDFVRAIKAYCNGKNYGERN